MTADFQLELSMEGNASEIKSMLEVVGQYGDNSKKAASFSFLCVNGNKFDFAGLTDDVAEELSSSTVKVTANGPYGRYSYLNDVDIFREMSVAAPNAHFTAEISGFQQYSTQNLKCELKDGKLNITTFFESNEESGEAWCADFMKKLPLKKFKKLFKVSGEDFNKGAYGYVVEEFESLCFDSFEEMEYDDFVSTIEDNDGETEIDEERFSEIISDEFTALGILCPEEFEDEYDGGETEEYIYDPISKSYENNSKPMMEGGITDATELIAAGLKAQGLPSDPESIAKLSVDEAYAALGATMGTADDEDDEDDDDWDDEEEDEDEE